MNTGMGITREQYQEVQNMVGILAYAAKDLPLHEFLEAIDLADTAGPILDPTLYKRAGDRMHEIKKLAQGLLRFQAAVKETGLSCFSPSFEGVKQEVRVQTG